jgi:hypothetical protein
MTSSGLRVPISTTPRSPVPALDHLKPLHAQADTQKPADLRVILDNDSVIHLAVAPPQVAAALRLRAAGKRNSRLTGLTGSPRFD